jgi:hypothetical protein
MTRFASAGIKKKSSNVAADASSSASAVGILIRGGLQQFSVSCMSTHTRVALSARVV